MIESEEQKLKMMNSQFPQDFQIQDPYSIFQVSQQEEPIDLDRSMKNLTKSENDFLQSINRLEAQMSRLINIVKDRNKETLPNTSSTISYYPSHIDRNDESWCLRDFDQDSISPQHLKLNKNQSIDKLASFSFNEIELDYECEPDLQPCDSVLIFKSMLTPISLTDLDSFPEPTLIPIFINLETEPLILDSHIPLMGRECEF